ncbi:MAG: glycosyltransferase family 92 protein [Alphaproteobacteria bacterium]|nr:glycosyltransferase family 92 protein [Alphaproteobacteria bacterium]
MKSNLKKYITLFILLLLSVVIASIHHTKLSQKKYYLSVVAIMKNEKPYLKEWLEYHLMQGVEHFYLCDNDSSDNTKEYLTPYINQNIITYIPKPGKNQQLKCYEQVVKDYKDDTYWLAIIDLDEYIVPIIKNNIPSFLKEFEYASEVSLQWMNYGDSNLFKRKDGLITETFTSHGGKLNHTVKSIVKPDKVIDFSIFGANHYTRVEGLSVNEYHKPVSFMLSYHISADKARINHYILKSFEEFVYKKKRGHPEGTSIDYEYYFYHNDNSVKNDKTMERFIKKLKKRMKKSPLKDIPHPIQNLKENNFDEFYFTPTEASQVLNRSVDVPMSFYELEKKYKNKHPQYMSK